MRALLQRIKELDRHTFEDFCFHLLKEMYPNASVRKVHGAAGDEGVDIFAGEWDSSSVVWQCKSFPNGVGASQKEQIRDSLRRVMDAVKPRLWVLILSVDLDAKTHRWWEKFKASYADRVTLELVSASDLVHQLIYRRTLGEAFFPAAIMDVSMLPLRFAPPLNEPSLPGSPV
jgi:hypothetical protein